MRGISEERLKAMYGEYQTPMESNLILMLLKGCEELSPWKPIDENTPKDKWLLVIDEAKDSYICKLDSRYGLWYADIGLHVLPTHWQDLPPLPEEK